MPTTQDSSVGFAFESTYKTGVTPTRWVEFEDESLDWNKSIKQGKGLRVGGRVARSARRVITSADGSGDIGPIECVSKGMGLLWQACLGAGSSALVAGSTYQQVFTLGDTPPSMTIQKGLVEAGGTVDPYTFLGCVVTAFELDFPNDDIATLKPTIDAGDLTTATSYAAPSYVANPSLYHFANGSIYTGTLTAPTATALASAPTTVANIRGGSLQVAHNYQTNRQNYSGGGRKRQPTVGLRDITGKMDVEYDSTTMRDAMLNDTPMNLIITFTGAALSTGVETLQIIVPEIKFDTELAKSNSTDLIVQSMAFRGLDNLTAAQPIWVVLRTADAAL